MALCRVCSRPGIREWLDFGPQPLANRFLRSAVGPEYAHPCRLGACRACGTVQLESPPPVEELRPRFPWLTYNEPERHLDGVADRLARLPGLSPAAVIGGITYKDDSTLKRLAARGLANTWRADPQADLGVDSPLGGIESVQARLPHAADRLAARYGRPDLLLVRHVLEHTHDVRGFLRAVRELVRPGGYALFELPDCRKALDRLDYTTVWEEHVFYFTPATLRHGLAAAGFEVVSLDSHYYTQDDVLVCVARPGPLPDGLPDAPPDLAGELARADRFVREFPRTRHAVQERVRGFTRGGGAFAMLGAGHLSGAFINLYGLAADTAFVADDNPHKHGLLMPGSRAPILPTAELAGRNVRLCLMTVRAEVEELVVGRNAALTAAGGVLASVFPDSKYALGKTGQPAGKAA